MRQLQKCLTALQNGSFKIHHTCRIMINCNFAKQYFVSSFLKKKIRTPYKFLFKGRRRVLCNIKTLAEFFSVAKQTDSHQYYQKSHKSVITTNTVSYIDAIKMLA